jgi:tRNA pseudouridine55 synthase
MNGLLLVNKPAGITSFDCIRKLRRTTGVKKIGHAGTLDPAATGLMLLLLGTACKQAQQFSKLDKTYVAQIELGKNSTTGDREGELTNISERQPDKEEIERTLGLFIGEITQTPSKYSAIKINGQEAYKRARRGEEVSMPSRQVTVNSIELLSYNYPYMEISADVSSGTYIRSLAEDIGKELGTGAYLTALRRTSIGGYNLKDAVNLDSEPEVVQRRLVAL